MARAYSTDLRERAVRAAQAGTWTRAEVAHRFGITEATLYHWLRRLRDEGTIEPRPRGGGMPASLDAAGMQRLQEIVEAQNDRTLAEYLDLLEEKVGVRLSRSALHRALKKLALPRKKRR